MEFVCVSNCRVDAVDRLLIFEVFTSANIVNLILPTKRVGKLNQVSALGENNQHLYNSLFWQTQQA